MGRLTLRLLPAVFLGLALVGCGAQPSSRASEATDDSGGREVQMAQETETAEDATVTVGDATPYYELGLNLLRGIEAQDGNVLVSPISLARPLAVVAEGAKGETLSQIEGVLGFSAAGIPADELKGLADSWSRDGDTFAIADSLWINDEFHPNPDFVATAEETYGAQVFDRAFDRATLTQINDWVDEHTKGMIPTILDDIDSDAALYVIDACAFDGRWEEAYEEDDVQPHDFTTADGAVQRVSMMWGSDGQGYLEDDWCTGFVKPYEGGRFSFVGLLPSEGTTVADLVNAIHGQQLAELIAAGGTAEVTTGLPKFDGEYAMDLKGVLEGLGMTDAFDREKADLTGMLEDPSDPSPWVGDVLQKTFVEVNEQGTRAAAATLAEIEALSLAPKPLEVKEVVLDRPFLYLIVDAEANVPLFMGTVGSIG